MSDKEIRLARWAEFCFLLGGYVNVGFGLLSLYARDFEAVGIFTVTAAGIFWLAHIENERIKCG